MPLFLRQKYQPAHISTSSQNKIANLIQIPKTTRTEKQQLAVPRHHHLLPSTSWDACRSPHPRAYMDSAYPCQKSKTVPSHSLQIFQTDEIPIPPLSPKEATRCPNNPPPWSLVRLNARGGRAQSGGRL